MKFFKSILIFLLLLAPFSVQASPDTLLNKLGGVWYNNMATVVFNFENNRYFLIIGATFYTVPITNVETIANVLFFETTSGKKTTMRLVSSDIAVWTSENSDESYSMYRWKKDNICRLSE